MISLIQLLGSVHVHNWKWIAILMIIISFSCNGVLMQCDLDIYISETDLATYYNKSNGTDSSFIIQNCTAVTNSNGYLLINRTTNETLPLLPRIIDTINIQWRTSDNRTQYNINITDASMLTKAFQNISISIPAVGTINNYQNGISVTFPCKDNVDNIGILQFTLQINTSNYGFIDTQFLLKKDCHQVVPTESNSGPLTPLEGSGIEDSVLVPYLTSSTIQESSIIVPSLTQIFSSQSSFLASSQSSFLASSQSSFLASSQSSFLVSSQSSFLVSSLLQSSDLVSPTLLISSPFQTSSLLQSTVDIYSDSLITFSSSLLPTGSPGPSQDSQGPPWLLFAIAFAPLVGILILSIAIVICCMCCIKCARRKPQPLSSGFFDNPNEIIHHAYDDSFELDDDKYKKGIAPVSLWTTLPWGQVTILPLHTQNLIKSVNIDRRKLTITNTFLKGDNGCLNHGLLLLDSINPMSILNQGTMIKMMTGLDDGGYRDDIMRFIEQALVMQGLEHDNILQVLGLSIENNCVPVIIYPIMEYGNFHSFLEFCRVSPESCPINPFGEEYKTNFGLQLASALRFLNEKGIIHTDIALRNCWLDTGYTVKLSDGVLSQEFYPDDYSTIKGAIRPVKWSALETLQEGLITTQSNVWSFGILLWEIFSMAQSPYNDVPNRSIISHLRMDERLEKPDDCIEEMYQLMMDCWKTRGEERLTITNIQRQLTHISSKLPSIVYPSGPAMIAPQLTEPTYTTFLSTDSQQTMPVTTERYSYTSLNDNQVTRHSGSSYISDSIMRRNNNKKKTNNLSGSSLRKSNGDHLSLSFSILSDDIDSSSSESDNEEEGDGSFPSTLRSTRSTTTGTITDSQPLTAGSIGTLQQSSSLGLYPPSVETGSDIASKTSTMDESLSDRSSVALQPIGGHSTSGTDRSSYYSTGIDSVISTTFSTPLPNSALNNTTPSIELKTYNVNNDDNQSNKTTPIETSSASPLIGKSTDSGIRIDEELCHSNNHHNDPLVPLRTDNNKLQPRDSSHISRTSFGLDMSSELMAAFEQFSFK